MRIKRNATRLTCVVLPSIVLIMANLPASGALIGRWDATEGTGTTVTAQVGGFNGTLNNNVTWGAGGPPYVINVPGASVRPNDHLDFGGAAADHVNFGTSSVFSPGSITVAFWARATGNHAGQVMLAKYQSFPGAWEFGFSQVPVNGNNYLFFRAFSGTQDLFIGSAAVDQVTPEEFNDGNWHFIVGTFQGPAGIGKLYYDGNLVVTQTMGAGGSLNSNTHALNAGRRAFPGAEAAYAGLLAGPILIYDEPLSAAQVQALLPEPGAALLMLTAGLTVVRRRRRCAR